MTTVIDRMAGSRAAKPRLGDRRRDLVLLALAAAVAVAGAGGATLGRAFVGLAGFVVFVVIALSGRTTALTITIVWLVLLGFARRLLIPFAGWSPNDPLLLVGPAAAAIMWYFSRRERPAPRSLLATTVGLLLLWVGAQVANPNEPGFLVAAQGALFYVGPLLWFFAGYHLTTGQHERVLETLFWMNIVVVGHGFYQTFVNLLPFEYTWLNASGMGPAIYVGGFNIRPFSTLVSPQEYGLFLAMALMLIWARMLKGEGPRGMLFLYWAVTVVALFYQASRGIFLLFVLGLVVVTVAHLRSVLGFLLLVFLGTGFTLYVGAQDGSPTPREQVQTAGSGALAQHQISGITNPTDTTAGLHVQLVVGALDAATDHPLGLGVSSGTRAAQKSQAQRIASAENDFGNVPSALGFPAAIAYVTIMIAAFAGVARLVRRSPTARHLAWLGFLVVTLGVWLNGGLYTVTSILWLAVGGIARSLAPGGLPDDDEDDEDDAASSGGEPVRGRWAGARA